MRRRKRAIKNGHSSKTRVKYIVSYFNGSLIEEYVAAAREDHLLQTSLAVNVNYKMVRSHRFRITYPRERLFATLEYIREIY